MHNLAGVERVDRRRMDDLREVLCIAKCLMGRLAKSRVEWAGYVERLVGDGLRRMADEFLRRTCILYWNGHNLFVHQLLGVYLCVRVAVQFTSDVIRTIVRRRHRLAFLRNT